jgi:hypothetical protein
VNHAVELQSSLYSYRFHTGWVNGVRQVMEPISFDMTQPGRIEDKAVTWAGRLHSLSVNSEDFQFTAVVAPPSAKELEANYISAKAILTSAPRVRAVLDESEAESFFEQIEAEAKLLV